MPVVNYKRRLDGLFDRAKEIEATSDDLELLSHWAKYLCVLVSGFLEVAVREIYSEYTRGRADQHILNCIRKQLEQVSNPRVYTIIEVTKWFSPDWAKQLDDQIGDKHRTSVGNIIANRNDIAHGKDSDVTYRRLADWYKDAVEVVEMMERQCRI